jgi:hypothetical protein
MEHGLREVEHPYSALPPEKIKEFTYNFNFPVIEPAKPKDYGVDGPGLLLIDFDASNGFDINNSWFFFKNIKIPAKECMENYINKKRKRERMEGVAEEIIKNKKQKS